MHSLLFYSFFCMVHRTLHTHVYAHAVYLTAAAASSCVNRSYKCWQNVREPICQGVDTVDTHGSYFRVFPPFSLPSPLFFLFLSSPSFIFRLYSHFEITEDYTRGIRVGKARHSFFSSSSSFRNERNLEDDKIWGRDTFKGKEIFYRSFLRWRKFRIRGEGKIL